MLPESAADLASAFRDGSASALDAVERSLSRIEQVNEELNAFVTVLAESARETARSIDDDPLTDRPLCGVPVAIKDLYAEKTGVCNTYGSVPFADNVSTRDAIVVERLEAAGAVVVGKTNTPEFGYKGITNNALFGATATPFDLDANAGGSSGGSAAAVAAGLVPVAQGSDGGGSIRIPAAACGIYGLKPTYGRIPYAGRPDAFAAHTPFGNSGPLARTVEDAALVLSVLAGPHPRDPLCAPDDGSDFVGALDHGIDGMRVAYTPDLEAFTVDDRVVSVTEAALEAFERAGATVEHVDVDLGVPLADLLTSWRTVSKVKYAAMAERLRDVGVDVLGTHRSVVADEIVALAEAGADVSGVAYKRTDEHRTRVFDAVQDVFAAYDLLTLPTLAVPSIPHDGVGPTHVAGVEIDPLLEWFLTWPFNLTGHPAASIPAGRTETGHPVGLQLVGRRFAETDVIAASAAFEVERPWEHWYDDLAVAGTST